MTEQTQLKIYSPDNPIRVELELEDASGVGTVTVMFTHKADPNTYIRLDGDGQGRKQLTLVLRQAVTEETVPGEYFCSWIYVSDVNGHHDTHTFTEGLKFIDDLRFMVDNKPGDYDPPQLKQARLG